MSIVEWVEFQSHGDDRGSLVAVEIGLEKAIPFEIKRVYYIYRTEQGVSRGYHAHKELRQVAIAVAGSCEMVLDDGFQRESILLDNPTKGLKIDRMIWREMHNFSEDCVLLVLASEHYDEDDYIRDYETFSSLVKS